MAKKNVQKMFLKCTEDVFIEIAFQVHFRF